MEEINISKQETSLEKIWNDPIIELFVRNMSPDMLSRLRSKSDPEILSFLEASVEELKQKPKLLDKYKKIFIEENHQELEKHTQERIRAIKSYYFRHVSVLDKKARKTLEEKLKLFQQYIDSLSIVRSEKKEFTGERFRSIRSINIPANSMGPQDIFVQSDKYVYSSFEDIQHYMSRNGIEYVLDEQEVAERGQVVMQDIVSLMCQDLRHGKTGDTLERYLNNTFNYNGGKIMLAYYLAELFESPEEAREFFINNTQRHVAETWIKNGFQKDMFFGTQVTDKMRKERNEKYSLIKKKAAEMRDTLDIEPPLTLEIRIPDSVRIIKRHTERYFPVSYDII